MQAFPKNSTNMQLGGSGPVNPKLNLDQYHGTEREAHNDYNEAAIVEGEDDYYRRPQPERSASFNPTARIEPVHGSLSAGLGTSTFLEGTPASRAAIQRRESEYEASQREATANGLSRTKSLAQRIKSVRPKITDGPRVNSPELAATPTSPLGSGKPDQSGTNPFFKDYDKDYEKKGAQIAFAEEQQKTGRARAPSSPKRGLGLERKLTADSTNPEEIKPSTGGGFLTRMKSLKTPRRPRERRNTETSWTNGQQAYEKSFPVFPFFLFRLVQYGWGNWKAIACTKGFSWDHNEGENYFFFLVDKWLRMQWPDERKRSTMTVGKKRARQEIQHTRVIRSGFLNENTLHFQERLNEVSLQINTHLLRVPGLTQGRRCSQQR
jgi:hypothetical protein